MSPIHPIATQELKDVREMPFAELLGQVVISSLAEGLLGGTFCIRCNSRPHFVARLARRYGW